jgi:hypothetical protein
VTLAAAFSGRIACKVVATVSAFPGSSSATPLRPVWSIYGSTRTSNDQLVAKIPDHAVRTTTWSGRERLRRSVWMTPSLVFLRSSALPRNRVSISAASISHFTKS